MKVQRTEIFCVEKMGMFRCAAPYAKFRWITYKCCAALPQRVGKRPRYLYRKFKTHSSIQVQSTAALPKFYKSFRLQAHKGHQLYRECANASDR
jgi:hypothetical protein